MANPDIYADKAKFKTTETSYKTASAELAKATTEYETAFEKVMELEDKIQG